LKDGKAEFPFIGDIPNADVAFTIDFKRDVEIVRAFDLKTDMSEYNKQHNAEHNREVIGRKKVEKTFSRLTGDKWTTQELLQQGFNDKNIKRFVDYGLIERTGRGKYKRLC
jgi:ACT domain-containing protein